MAPPVLARMPVAAAGAAVAAGASVAHFSTLDPRWPVAGPAALLAGAAWLLLPRRPLWAVAPILLALFSGFAAAGDDTESLPAMVLTLLVVTYRVGETQTPRRILAVLAFITLSGQAMTIASGEWYPGDILFATTVYALPMLLGRVVATGREATAELEARTAELEAERRRRAALEVGLERERLAAQVNAVVTGALRAMVDDAGRGLHALATDRAAAASTLADIEATGREALREMRALLGVLREDEAHADAGRAAA